MDLENDSGRIHLFVLKNTYLIPNAATWLLLPQHLAQQAKHYSLFQQELESSAWTSP